MKYQRRIRSAIRVIIAMLSISSVAYAAEDVVGAVHGSITKIDSSARTVIVKTKDGAERSFRVSDRTIVHGMKGSVDVSKDTWRRLSEGSEVVAHYTERGTADSAVEIDKIGRDGLRSAKGTIKDGDRGSEKLVIKAGDGTETTFRMTDRAAKDAAKGIDNAGLKGAKVTVYYSEDAGKKVAHFFE